jgi:peptidoglycan/LPS O-acetylase OafA/YrhL
MSKAGNAHHLLALDGLRGVAILSVPCFHLFIDEGYSVFGIGKILLPVARMGWVGVEVFFVLSGFLITGILLTRNMSGRAGFRPLDDEISFNALRVSLSR